MPNKTDNQVSEVKRLEPPLNDHGSNFIWSKFKTLAGNDRFYSNNALKMPEKEL